MKLRAQIFLVAEVMKTSAIKFLIADAISALFTNGSWGGIGYLAGNSLQVFKKNITRIEHLAILMLAVIVSVWILYLYFKGYNTFEKRRDGGVK